MRYKILLRNLFTQQKTSINRGRWIGLSIMACSLGLFGCASKQSAPIVERSVNGTKGRIKENLPPKNSLVKKDDDTDQRAGHYSVKRGDTLYGIALDHGLDYKELAAWNNMENPNRILVGQILRLTPSEGTPSESNINENDAGVVLTPLQTNSAPGAMLTQETPKNEIAIDSPEEQKNGATKQANPLKTQPKALKLPHSEANTIQLSSLSKNAGGARDNAITTNPPIDPVSNQNSQEKAEKESKNNTGNAGTTVAMDVKRATVITPPTADPEKTPTNSPVDAENDDARVDWTWPTPGKIIANFAEGVTPNKGIDIAGKLGQPIQASAPGKVVYSGTGLRGYGKLLIIKHNKTYLSAYAHNKEIVVKEGEMVKKGQKIAEMGNTDSEQTKLHFEIRRLGKPVDPMKHLPAERG